MKSWSNGGRSYRGIERDQLEEFEAIIDEKTKLVACPQQHAPKYHPRDFSGVPTQSSRHPNEQGFELNMRNEVALSDK